MKLNLTFELQYFKFPSGKYYTNGRLTMLVGVGETGTPHTWEVANEVKRLQAINELPGINGNEWIIHVSHPLGCPFIILPPADPSNADDARNYADNG